MLRYKACRNSIVTLELLDNSVTSEERCDVVDDNYAKFRCNMAKVINIVNVKTGKTINSDRSIHDINFVYTLGEIVKTDFNTCLDRVCAEGIHYFKTKETALSWFIRHTNYWPDGKIKQWYDNGQKKAEVTFKKGEPDGKYISWWKNGEKNSEKTWKNGKLHGKCTVWNEKGKILSEEYY